LEDRKLRTFIDLGIKIWRIIRIKDESLADKRDIDLGIKI
jgi:hypothetical protein